MLFCRQPGPLTLSEKAWGMRYTRPLLLLRWNGDEHDVEFDQLDTACNLIDTLFEYAKGGAAKCEKEINWFFVFMWCMENQLSLPKAGCTVKRTSAFPVTIHAALQYDMSLALSLRNEYLIGSS